MKGSQVRDIRYETIHALSHIETETVPNTGVRILILESEESQAGIIPRAFADE